MKKNWIVILLHVTVLSNVLSSYAYASGGGDDLISSLFFFIIVMGIIFLILREFFCWYWKINERLVVLKQIRDLLVTIAPEEAKAIVQEETQLSYSEELDDEEGVEDESPFCYHCGAEIPEGFSKCQGCGKEI